MSVTIGVGGSLQPNAPTKLTPVALSTTGITDIYTAVDNLDVVVAVQICNNVAGAVDVVVDHFDGTTNWHTWAKTFGATKDSVTFSDFPVRLRSGDKIRATASVANQLTVSLAVMKVPGRNQSP